MLTPIEWKQVAGYPSAAFCVKHDRLIEPIVLTDGSGACTWGCPYCAEEEMSQVAAKSKEPERPVGFFTGSRWSPVTLTFWCPEKQCPYNTTVKQMLEIHTKVIHNTSGPDKMKCAEGLCDKDAVDFCTQCESAMCKDHIDWHDLCPACGSMYPYA